MQEKTMTPTDLATALIAGVPRYTCLSAYGPPDQFMEEADVLAALTAALEGADERAGEIVSELREVAAVFTKDTVFTDAADLITALLAKNAALRAEAQEMGAGMVTLSHEHSMERARANAAEAREERLRVALELIADTDPDEGTAWFHTVANAALTTEKRHD